MVAITKAKAAVSLTSDIAFEASFDDKKEVFGNAGPDGIVVNAHPCTVASNAHSGGGGFVSLLDPGVGTGVCPHAAALPTVLGDLLQAAGNDSGVEQAVRSALPVINAKRGSKIGGFDWIWTPAAGWERGSLKLRSHTLTFPVNDELNEAGFYITPNPNYVPFKKTFARLDAIAYSPIYEAVQLVGPSGHGKTELARQWCASRKRPCYEITLGATARVEDLVGGISLENGSTVYRPGLVRLLSKPGGTLIINELSAPQQRDLVAFWPFIEKGRTSVQIPVDGNIYTIPIHPTAMVISTANEQKAIHSEANGSQSAAQLRRFTIVPVRMTVDEIMQVAKHIVRSRLDSYVIDLGDGTKLPVPDRRDLVETFQWAAFSNLVAHLEGKPEVRDILEISPETVASAVIDASHPDIGVSEAIRSHFVLKVGDPWNQELVAQEIINAGQFIDLHLS